MKLTMICAGLAALAALSVPAFAQRAGEEPQVNEKQKATEDQRTKEKQQANDAQRAGNRSTQRAEPVVLTVTTVSFAESTGCWVKLYDGENFTGRSLTLMGAQSLPNLEFGIGYDWEGDIDSVLVGPKARLALYDDEDYTDDRRDLAENARVADLHKTLFDEGVESMSLTCTGDTAR